jgi:adenine-specific DNA-methyltransferase
MIYARLMVARSLLTEDGVICIQIDDNEFCTLKKICDEVFGEDNFMTTIVVKMSEPTGMKMAHASTRIPKLKEYIIVYTKKQITINPVRIPKDKWDYEYKSIIEGINEDEIKFIKIVRDNESRTENDIKRVNEILKKATYSSLSELYKERNIKKDQDKETFNFSNSWRIFQTVSMTGGAKQLSDNSRKSLNQLFFCIVTP